MDSAELEERYLHFMTCIDDLQRAWTILQDVKKADPKSAYELALVEYSKPYKVSFGNIKKHQWPSPKYAGDDLKLHERILLLRDKVLAHSDLPHKEAKIHATRYAKEQVVTVVMNIREQMPPLDGVLALIEKTLMDKAPELAKLEQALG